MIVDFLEAKIDHLPESMVVFDEPIVEAKSRILPVEKAPDGQGPNERRIKDPMEEIETIVSRKPYLQVVPESTVHTGSGNSEIDKKTIRFLMGKNVPNAIGPELWFNPTTQEAAHSVRALNVDEPNIASIQRLGTKPLSLDDIPTAAD